jgi:hypothetical protein
MIGLKKFTSKDIGSKDICSKDIVSKIFYSSKQATVIIKIAIGLDSPVDYLLSQPKLI